MAVWPWHARAGENGAPGGHARGVRLRPDAIVDGEPDELRPDARPLGLVGLHALTLAEPVIDPGAHALADHPSEPRPFGIPRDECDTDRHATHGQSEDDPSAHLDPSPDNPADAATDGLTAGTDPIATGRAQRPCPPRPEDRQ
jgi:hypothetical protein